MWRDIHTQSLETLSESSSKASKELQEFQHSNTKNIWRKIIQIILLDLKVHWNQAQKHLETLKDYKLVKLYGFKLLNPEELSRRASTTNLWRRIYEKRKIYNKLIAKDSSQFRSKDLSSHFPIKVRTSCVWIKTNIDTILELMTFLRRLNQMTIILYYNLNTLNCTYKFINTKIHWWNYFDCLISKLEILYLQ